MQTICSSLHETHQEPHTILMDVSSAYWSLPSRMDNSFGLTNFQGREAGINFYYSFLSAIGSLSPPHSFAENQQPKLLSPSLTSQHHNVFQL